MRTALQQCANEFTTCSSGIRNVEMAGLPEFLYSDRTESEVALIAPVADADGERAHMSSLTDEAGSDGLEGEFGDAVLRRERSAFPLGTASQSRPPKSTVNTGKMRFSMRFPLAGKSL